MRWSGRLGQPAPRRVMAITKSANPVSAIDLLDRPFPRFRPPALPGSAEAPGGFSAPAAAPLVGFISRVNSLLHRFRRPRANCRTRHSRSGTVLCSEPHCSRRARLQQRWPGITIRAFPLHLDPSTRDAARPGSRADANNRYSKVAPIIIRVVLGMIASIRARAT